MATRVENCPPDHAGTSPFLWADTAGAHRPPATELQHELKNLLVPLCGLVEILGPKCSKPWIKLVHRLAAEDLRLMRHFLSLALTGYEATGRVNRDVAGHVEIHLRRLVGYAHQLRREHSRFDEPEDLEAIADLITSADSVMAFWERHFCRPPELIMPSTARQLGRMATRNLGRWQFIAGSEKEVHLDLRSRTHDCLLPEHELICALDNLVMNAAEATSPGDYIAIRAMVSHPAGSLIEICVEDNGCGMNTATQAHFLLSGFSTKHGRGRGLGMTSVQRLVQQLSGDLRIRSTFGIGTSITMTLPTKRASNPAELQATSSSGALSKT